MCGIAGFIDPSRASDAEDLAATASVMAHCLAHRGPDDQGVWTDADSGVAFGHRRLSIIDLSPEGHQPMLSADGRWVVAFNGEIYNFTRLRPELEARGHTFRGHSDTEVLLAAVSDWGVEGALGRFNGMFAIALWDRSERRLWLARDRMGEKPLYYGSAGGVFLFASELKALHQHPAFDASVDRDALALFFRYGYVPAPHCIYAGIRKLEPGCLMSFRPGDGAVPSVRSYWSLREVAERGAAERGAAGEKLEELESVLSDAVGLRMTADVPLGALLSGGIDSSTVVALMQAQSSRPVRTFTIGFREAGYDEAGYAREVARHLGTDHTELYVSPQDALDVIPLLPEIYDEPFADSSQIPTYLVSQLARRHVTVALSGDGGDELFLGYDRYRWAGRLWQLHRSAPAAVRRGAVRALSWRGPGDWDRLAARAAGLLRRPPARVGDRLHRLSGLLEATSALDLYAGLMTHWADPPVLGAGAPDARLTDPAERADLPLLVDQVAYLDGISYLPDDILAKVDRASMAVSLEARIPLLDHRVVEQAWRIPPAAKSHRGRTKWPLRRVLARHVPEAMVDRPKMGFGVPVGDWLRGPLRDWAESLLDERRLAADGYLQPGPVRDVWRRHLEGRAADQHLLWDVLMFQAWAQHAKV